VPDGLASLPLVHPRRPLNAYPSNNKRAATRMKTSCRPG
jgi:hypothetical protein